YSDYGGIIALWQEAFGDTKEYIEMFLNQKANNDNILLYKKDNVVISMLFILPCRLVQGEVSYPCAYLYCLATLKEYRGNGISTKLLDFADKLLIKRGYAAAVLVPANELLFMFYNKRGYSIQGGVNTLVLNADKLSGNSDIEFTNITAENIVNLRKQYFGSCYLEWDLDAVKYIIKEIQFVGGDFYGFSVNGVAGFVAVAPWDDRLIIREFAGDIDLLIPILQKLHSIYNKKQYVLWLSKTCGIGRDTELAMTKWYKSKEIDSSFYLSHYLA
ncbi:MAG: GNAT family N-acetyltransferase, partial [Oscillospiraceae bacterium]